jgi:hypothetical protein
VCVYIYIYIYMYTTTYDIPNCYMVCITCASLSGMVSPSRKYKLTKYKSVWARLVEGLVASDGKLS